MSVVRNPVQLLMSVSASVVLLFAAIAHATDATPSAEALFQAGRLAAQEKQWDRACQLFAESHRLEPAVGTLLNLAVCHEERGLLADAWGTYHAALDQATDPSRRSFIRQRLETLRPRVPWLTIDLAADARAHADVSHNGILLGEASLGVALPVNPGKQRVTVAIPGRSTTSRTITLREGERRRIAVAPGIPLRNDQQHAPAAPRLRPWTYLSFSVGAAGLATAAVTGAFALRERAILKDHCESQQCDDTGLDAARRGRSYVVANAIASAVGVAGLTAGVTFAVIQRKNRSGQVALRATYGAGVAGAVVGGAF